jgi:hypothetical protein
MAGSLYFTAGILPATGPRSNRGGLIHFNVMSDFNRVKQLFSAVYWPWVGFVSARFLVVFPFLLATGEKKRDISAVLSIGADQEKLKEDPELMFLGLALYEFLINKLQHWDSGMPPYMMVDLLKSRKETREAIGLLKDISANKAINQLYSMSKSMGFANSQEKN